MTTITGTDPYWNPKPPTEDDIFEAWQAFNRAHELELSIDDLENGDVAKLGAAILEVWLTHKDQIL